MRLTIPQIEDDWDLYRAAIAYADAGWYVGPLAPRTKNPGAILGDHWQSKTSRDHEVIAEWFIGTPAGGLFLHVGKSGALGFDVDYPDKVPEVLAKYLWGETWDESIEDREAAVPFQSTRPAVAGKGHYIVLQPDGVRLGNGVGSKLGEGWGEIRGRNGILVVEPTIHEADDGLYRWQVTGEIPVLWPEIADLLPDGSDEVDAATDDEVAAFLDTFIGSDDLRAMQNPLDRWDISMGNGASRHDTAVKIACWMLREAGMGLYPAREAMNLLWEKFNAAMKARPTKGRFPKAEFFSIVAYAVGQVLTLDLAKRREEYDARRAEAGFGQGKAKSSKPSRPQSEPPAALECGIEVNPDKYFWDRTVGLDVAMLADDILEMGLLAIGRDGQFWEYRDGVWRCAPKVVKQRAVVLLHNRYRQAHASNVTDVIEQRVETILCDPVGEYLNFRNGMLHWESGELIPHDPSFHSTVQFPWDWTGDDACPMFDAFLSSTLSPDYIHLAWQMIGYLLYSGNPRQVAFLLYGPGGSGKSTLLRIISTMLGKENIATETLNALNSNRFSAVNLFGMIANIAGDIDATYQTESATFKTITGEDQMGGEHKYGSRFAFTCWAVPVFSANKVPGSADTTSGYTRRWKVLRFTTSLPSSDQIIGYSEKMSHEIPGIMARAIKYLREVIASGFKEDGDVADGMEEFKREIDVVRQWIEDVAIQVPQEHGENRTTLYKSYRAWASENGTNPLKAHEFYLRLGEAGFPATKKNGVRMHLGLRVLELRMKGSEELKDMPSDPYE